MNPPETSAQTPRRLGPRLTIALLCATHLVIGLALGLALGWRTASDRPRLPPPGEMEARLGLDADQSAKVRAIFERHRPDFDRLRVEHRAQLKAVRDQVDSEFQQVLRPDQFEKLVELRRELEAAEAAGPPGSTEGPKR